MYAFLVSYECHDAENRKGFYEALKAAGVPEAVRAEKGCLRYEYFVPCEEEDRLFLLEQWESPEDQKLHLTQPHMAPVGAIKARFGVATTLMSWKIAE